jgi:outer membrane autotransporter protein
MFVGGLRGKQTMGLYSTPSRNFGAETKMDSLAVGVFADTSLAGFGLHGIVAFDGGRAQTSREMPVTEGTAKASYDLNNWVADLRADYAVRLGEFSVTPKVAVTYVHTSRAAAVEQGAGAFSLSVDKGSKDSWFGEAALAFSGTFDLGGMKLSPYAQGGVRQVLGNGALPVTGRFTGAPGDIVVNGVERDRTAVRVELGVGLDLTSSVRLQAGYTGEYAGTKRDSVMGGLSVRF